MDNPSFERRTFRLVGFVELHIEKDPKDGSGNLFHRNGLLCVESNTIPFVLERTIRGKLEDLYTNGRNIHVGISRHMPVKDERPGYATFMFTTNLCEFRGSVLHEYLGTLFSVFGSKMVMPSLSVALADTR